MGYEKGIICTKKRFPHQKSERKEEKTQPCTEGYYQSSVVIKGCKTTIYRYRKENSTWKTKKAGREDSRKGEKSLQMKYNKEILL